MNGFSLIPLIAVAAYIPLLIIMITSRPWHKQKWFFVFYLVAAMVWSSLSFVLRSNFLPQHDVLLAKLNICAFVWMAVQLYLFSRSFGYGSYIAGLALGYGLLAGTILLAAQGYIPQSVTVTDEVNISMGSWLYVIFIPLALLMVDNVIAQLRKLRRLTDQVQRTRVAYILIGVCIMALFSLTNAFEVLSRLPIDHFGNMVAAGLWTYATVKHQIVDIRFVARRGLSWAALLAISIVTWLVFYWILGLITSGEARIFITASVTLLSFFLGMIVYRMSTTFSHLVDRIFFRESYDYRRQLIDFVNYRISGIFSFTELCAGLLPLIARSLRCQQAYLMLPATINADFVVEYTEPQKGHDTALRIRQDSPIITRLQRTNRVFAYEELDISPEFRGLLAEERKLLSDMGVELFFPLVSRGNLIGILLLGKRQSGSYALEDIDLVHNITGQVSGIVEKEYLQEQLRRREQELTLINRMDRVIASSLNIHDVFEDFIKELRTIVDADWASIIWIEGDKVHFETLATQVGSAWQEGERIDLKGTAVEWLINNKRVLVERDLNHTSRFFIDAEFIKLGIRSVAYLPFIRQGSVISSLIIASRRPDAYSIEKIDLLERLTHQIASSVENSRLYAYSEQRARMDELTQLFNRRHFDECLSREISLQSRQNGVLCLILLDLDLFKDYNDKYGHPEGDKILMYIGKLIINALRTADLAFRYGGDEFAVILPGATGKDAQVVAERIRSRILKNMQKEQTGITASLGIASWPGDGVTPDELLTAADRALFYAKRTGGDRSRMVSDMLPLSVRSAASDDKPEKETLSMIYAFAATIEARDKYTYGHSRNVRRYSVLLAEALDLPSETVAIIGTAALLHDIGKIGISDDVLNKADKLTDKEWDLIKTHSELSAAIIGHVPQLTSCLPAILHHHERWDGKGYPSSLKGEAIPLEARVLAVADAFEAMISIRPYRGQLAVDAAAEELKRNAGTQFDPGLIEAFIPVIQSLSPEELGLKNKLKPA